MRSILRQSSYLFLAQFAAKAITFFFTIYLARVLGVENFGLYTAALSYFAIISSAADFGFNRFLIREAAKDSSKVSSLLSNILFLRLTLTSVLFAVFALFLYTLDPDSMRVSLTLLAVMAIIPQSASFTFDAVFVAFSKLQYSAAALFFSAAAASLLALYLIYAGFGVFGAVGALILGHQIIYALLLFLFLLKKRLISYSAIKLNIFKEALKGSLPYGLLGVLGLIYFKIDAVMLSYLKGSFETGLYGAAYKFLESIVFVPGAFAAALFPALAKLHDVNKPEMKKLYFKSLKLMLAVGVFIALAYLFILPEIIKILLPDYLSSIPAVRILAISIPFIFLATPGVQVLFSSDKYLKSVIFLSLFTMIFNVTLNFIFIPAYGFLAAAWVTVASEILSFSVFYLLIIRKKVFEEK